MPAFIYYNSLADAFEMEEIFHDPKRPSDISWTFRVSITTGHSGHGCLRSGLWDLPASNGKKAFSQTMSLLIPGICSPTWSHISLAWVSIFEGKHETWSRSMFWTAATTWWWIRPPPFLVSYKKKHILCLPPHPTKHVCIYTRCIMAGRVMCPVTLFCRTWLELLVIWVTAAVLRSPTSRPILTSDIPRDGCASVKSPVDQQFVQFKTHMALPHGAGLEL